MCGITIRRATAADVDGYLDLREAVAEERIWIASEPPVTDRDEAGRRIRESLHLESRLVLVADAVGDIVGSLSADEVRGRVVLGMMVAREWRSRGIGGKLLAECLAWAKTRGAHKLSLEVWPHNTAAIALYKRHGFAIEGRLRRHYRRQNGELWDALIMGRTEWSSLSS